MSNKIPFKVKVNDQEINLAVVRPNQKQKQEGEKVYNKAFRDAINSGAILREKIDDLVREQKIWGDEEDNQLKDIYKNISELELKLAKGGISVLEGRDAAISIVKYRNQIRNLTSKRSNLDNNCAQAQAENQRFLYYAYVCTVYEDTKKPYFKSYDEFENDETGVGTLANLFLMQLLYNFNSDTLKNLPENKFLQKYKFVDAEGNYVDKDGNLVDEKMRKIDKEGRLIDDKGNLIDDLGNPIDKDGNFIVDDAQPFLDEDGKPISV